MDSKARQIIRNYFDTSGAEGKHDTNVNSNVKHLIGELFAIADKLSRHTTVGVVIHYMGSCNTIDIMYGMLNVKNLDGTKYTHSCSYPLNHPDVQDALEDLCKRLTKMYVQMTSRPKGATNENNRL